jgi:hypothetical protein
VWAVSLDHRDRLVCVAAEVLELTSEHGSCSAVSAHAMNNDAFAALHTSSGEACRVQDAVAFGRRIEWLTATDKILKQDLMRGQRSRVVVARVKTNELLEAAPMQLHPVSVSGRKCHASEQGWDSKTMNRRFGRSDGAGIRTRMTVRVAVVFWRFCDKPPLLLELS